MYAPTFFVFAGLFLGAFAAPEIKPVTDINELRHILKVGPVLPERCLKYSREIPACGVSNWAMRACLCVFRNLLIVLKA